MSGHTLEDLVDGWLRYQCAAEEGLGPEDLFWAVSDDRRSDEVQAVVAAGPMEDLLAKEYLRKALEDELKVAGVHGASDPRIVLTGTVNKLEFSSSRGLTGGSWDIDVVLSSSNGRRMSASEHYEFQSGFVADTACKQTAEAYMPTVQNLIKKIVQSPEFKGLVQ